MREFFQQGLAHGGPARRAAAVQSILQEPFVVVHLRRLIAQGYVAEADGIAARFLADAPAGRREARALALLRLAAERGR